MNPGDERLDVIRASLFSVERSHQQTRIFKAFTGSCLSVIYGPYWHNSRYRVLSQMDLACIPSVVILTRRRCRITELLGVFVAAMLRTCKGVHIGILTTGRRARDAMCASIISHLIDYSQVEFDIKVGTGRDQSYASIMLQDDETLAHQPDVVFVTESALTSDRFFDDTLTPLMDNGGRACICMGVDDNRDVLQWGQLKHIII